MPVDKHLGLHEYLVFMAFPIFEHQIKSNELQLVKVFFSFCCDHSQPQISKTRFPEKGESAKLIEFFKNNFFTMPSNPGTSLEYSANTLSSIFVYLIYLKKLDLHRQFYFNLEN